MKVDICPPLGARVPLKKRLFDELRSHKFTFIRWLLGRLCNVPTKNTNPFIYAPGSHSSVRRLAPGLAGDGGWRSPAHALTWPPRCGRAGAARLLHRKTVFNKKCDLLQKKLFKKFCHKTLVAFFEEKICRLSGQKL
jgi:hypothetical protein